MGKLISVIVPVYNVEKYLEQCLDSIISQTFESFELILINDGSKDKSGNICDNYAENDERIKVIHKENGGLASACLCGIQNSKGEYTLFVDSDDWIDRDMLETLYNQAKLNDAQIVLCHAVREYKNKSKQKKMHLLEEKKYNESEILTYIFPELISNGYRVQKSISNSRCAKLFKSNLLKSNIKYYRTDIVNGEDLQLTFPTILDSKGIYCINNYFPYHYRVNEESITRTYNRNFLEKSKELYIHLNFIAKEKDVYDFSNQFNVWFINRVLVSINQEFKLWKVSTKIHINNKIVEICNDLTVKKIINSADTSKFSLVDKFLLKLIKTNNGRFIYNFMIFKETVKNKVKL